MLRVVLVDVTRDIAGARVVGTQDEALLLDHFVGREAPQIYLAVARRDLRDFNLVLGLSQAHRSLGGNETIMAVATPPLTCEYGESKCQCVTGVDRRCCWLPPPGQRAPRLYALDSNYA